MTTFPEHPDREPPDNDCPSCDEMASVIRELEAENHKLREALERYGFHRAGCAVVGLTSEDLYFSDPECTCGWTETEKELI